MQPYKFKNLLYGEGQKSVYRICKECGKGKWIRINTYSDLCRSCATNNKNHPAKRPEVRKKMSESAKIKIFTDEHKANISKGITGKNNPFYGKHHSNETLKKMCDCKKGEDHPMWGKKQSLESRIKRSCTRQGIEVDDFDGFTTRDHLLSELQCIKLNKKFNNSDFHHITKSIGVYIPTELHRHIWHDLKTGLRMGEINLLALQYINGEL